MSKRNAIFSLVVLAAALSPLDGAFAQSSCSARTAICLHRCRTDFPAMKGCPSEFCYPKQSGCLVSGCWQDAPYYGGAQHCNLVKR